MSLPISTRAVGLEQSVEAIVNKINRRGLNLKINASQFTQPLGRITDKANEFTKSLEASNARVIAFGASAALIGGVGKVFEQLVVQAVKFEKIMTDINVVLGTTSRNLEKFGQQLFGVAKNTSQALDVAAEAALEFSRQGLGMEETLKRTNDALILTRLTGMKAADAVKSLTAAVNGFADAGITTSAIINKMAAVDVKFAVSADDLANALARAGAVAQDAGVSFDQLIAAVTSAQQITARGGNVIGNSFKTIFTRIQRSSTLNKLQELGVAVRDLKGDTLPAMRVLTNLAKTYDTLTAAQKASTAEAVGGVFQINILKAGMKDLAKTNSLYSQALNVSANATDQAYKKNEQLQKTLSSLAAQTSLSFQELAKNVGELSLAPGISGILEAVNSAVEGLNEVLGKNADGIGSDVAKGLVKGFGKVLTGPGMVLALGIFGKLFFSALRFAKQSLKDVLGIVTAKDKEKKIQDAIVEAMQDNKVLALELNKYAGDKVMQEKIILGVIQEQTNFLEKQRKIAASLAPGLARRGVSGSLTLPSVSSSSSSAATGLIPNFAESPSPMDRVREKSAAQKGGYAAGSVRSLDMPGLGRVVYNSAEEVRKIPGMRQPAIMPPPNSKAGYQYRSDFRNKHGYNPYDNGFTSDNNSGGSIPNFAQLMGNTLRLGPSPTKLVGGANFRNRKLDKAFEHSSKTGSPMYLESSISQIAGKRGSNNAYLHDVLTGLSKKGIQNIGRNFYVENKARTTRMKRLPGETADEMQERATIGARHKAGQKGYFSTGGKRGDKNFPVDAIGRGLNPLEVKDGQIDKHNVLQKSLRLYSDSELLRFASQYPELNAKISSANQAHRGKAERMLAGKGVLRKGYGYDEAEESILSHHIGGGFIPNFARNTKAQMQASFKGGRTYENRIGEMFGKPPGYNSAFDWYPGNRPNVGKVQKSGLIGSGVTKINRGSLNSQYIDAHTGAGAKPGHSPAQLLRKLKNAGLIDKDALWDHFNTGNPIQTDFTEILQSGGPPNKRPVTKKSGGISFQFFQDQFNPRKGRKTIEKETTPHMNWRSKHAAGGFIPNFADPLTEAIGRESAAGVSKSMMRLEQDDSLSGRGNPFGLAITNTRDEPNGIKQGIRRAKRNNVDPKKHGIPNYAGLTTTARAPGVPAANRQLGRMEGFLKSAGDSMGRFDMQLMGLTTATYFLEGAFEDAESGIGKFMGGLTATIQGLSQGAQLFSVGAQASTSWNAKVGKNTAAGGKWTKAGGGKMGAALGGVGKLSGAFGMLLGPVGLLVGLLPPLIGILKQFEMFQSPMERLVKSIEKTQKQFEAISNTVSNFNTVEEKRKKYEELKNSNAPRTLKTEVALYNTKTDLLATELKYNNEVTELAKTIDLTDVEMEKLKGSSKGASIFLARLHRQSVVKQETQNLIKGMVETQSERPSRAVGGTAFVVDTALSFVWSGGSGSWTDYLVDVEAAENKYLQHRELFVRALGLNTKQIAMGGEAAEVGKVGAKLKDLGTARLNTTSDDNDGGMLGVQNVPDQKKLMNSASKIIDDSDLPEDVKVSLITQVKTLEQFNDVTGAAGAVQKMGVGMSEIGDGAKVTTDDDVDQDFLDQLKRNREDLLRGIGMQAVRAKNAGIIQAKQNSIDVGILGESLERRKALKTSTKESILQGVLANKRTKQTKDHELALRDNEKTALKSSNSILEKLILKDNLISSDFVSTAKGKANIEGTRDKLGGLIGADLSKAVNPKQIQDAVLKYVTSFDTLADQNEAIRYLKEEEVIAQYVSLDALKKVSEDYEEADSQLKKINVIKGLEIDESGKVLQRTMGTTKFYDQILHQLENNADLGGQIVGVVRDELMGETSKAKASELLGRKRLDALKESDYLAERSLALAGDQIIADSIKLVKDNSILEAKIKILETTDDVKNLVVDQHSNMLLQSQWDLGLLETKIKLYETTRALEEEVAAQLDLERGKRKEVDMRARETHGQKLKAGDYADIGGKGMTRNLEGLEGKDQALRGKMAAFRNQSTHGTNDGAGNLTRLSATNVEYAQNLKTLNEELNTGTLAWDSIRVKIAEADDRATRFAETLANTSFDAVRDGFSAMFSGLADGSKKASTVMLGFFAGIAEKIQQKLFDTAADRLTSGLFKVFQFHSGGFVSNYANGGKAGGDIPAMLTAGEYVVRKKVVDRVGTGALDKMNNEGSLDELFNEPNRDNFDLLGDGSNGGSMVTQNFDSGGLVKLLKLNGGGLARLDEYDKKSAISDITYGVGVGAGAAYAGYKNRDKGNDDDAPTAPMTKGVNTSSALNLGFADPRLSGKYRQDNQNSQDQGKYLLDKYNYDVNKKNAKEREKAAMLSTIIGTVGLGVGAAVGKKIGDSMADSIVASRLSGGGVKSENGNVMSYSPGKGFSSDARGVGGKYVGDLNDRFAGHRGASEDVGQSAKGAAKFLREKGFLVGRTGNPLFAAPRPQEMVPGQNPAAKASSCPGGVCPQSYGSKNSSSAPAPKSSGKLQRVYDDLMLARSSIESNQDGRGPALYQKDKTEYNRLVDKTKKINSGFFGSLEHMNAGGQVTGPAGIDKVGPVMLDSGEYVIKSNSAKGIEKDFPGLLDKLNAGAGFAEGGSVGDQVAPASSSKTSNSTSNNVTVNISVGANGSASTQVQGQSENQNAEGLGSRLKEAVLGVIASEKRVGGMLSGH